MKLTLQALQMQITDLEGWSWEGAEKLTTNCNLYFVNRCVEKSNWRRTLRGNGGVRLYHAPTHDRPIHTCCILSPVKEILVRHLLPKLGTGSLTEGCWIFSAAADRRSFLSKWGTGWYWLSSLVFSHDPEEHKFVNPVYSGSCVKWWNVLLTGWHKVSDPASGDHQ